MEYTQNYPLPLWDKEDAVLRTDFNENNQKIDAALGAAGNCRIACGTYTGTGNYGVDNPNTLTFDFTPKVVFIYVTPNYRGVAHTSSSSSTSYWSVYNQIFYCGASSFIVADSDGTGTVYYTLENNALTWHTTLNAYAQMNSVSFNYAYVAIG